MVHSRWLILAALIATWSLGSMSSQQATQFPCVLEVTGANGGYTCAPAASLVGSQGPAGATGATGAQGPAGAVGPAGPGIAGQSCAVTAGIPAGQAVLQISVGNGLCVPVQIVLGPPPPATANNLLVTAPPCQGYDGGATLPCFYADVLDSPSDGTVAGALLGLPQAGFAP